MLSSSLCTTSILASLQTSKTKRRDSEKGIGVALTPNMLREPTRHDLLISWIAKTLWTSQAA